MVFEFYYFRNNTFEWLHFENVCCSKIVVLKQRLHGNWIKLIYYTRGENKS